MANRDELKDLVMVMVLARLQAEGKTFETISQEELLAIVKEAADDLKVAADAIERMET